MNTRRRGSRRPWYFFHRARRRAMSGRSCSAANRLFFDRDPFRLQQPPQRPVARRHATTHQLRHQGPQRQVRLLGKPRQNPAPLTSQYSRAMTAHPIRRRTPRRPEPLAPLHNTGNAHPKQRRRRPAGAARRDRADNTLPKINRIGSCHKCWPPTPASILKQKSPALGIPISDSDLLNPALETFSRLATVDLTAQLAFPQHDNRLPPQRAASREIPRLTVEGRAWCLWGDRAPSGHRKRREHGCGSRSHLELSYSTRAPKRNAAFDPQSPTG
jgi:hypothetical protein